MSESLLLSFHCSFLRHACFVPEQIIFTSPQAFIFLFLFFLSKHSKAITAAFGSIICFACFQLLSARKVIISYMIRLWDKFFAKNCEEKIVAQSCRGRNVWLFLKRAIKVFKLQYVILVTSTNICSLNCTWRLPHHIHTYTYTLCFYSSISIISLSHSGCEFESLLRTIWIFLLTQAVTVPPRAKGMGCCVLGQNHTQKFGHYRLLSTFP